MSKHTSKICLAIFQNYLFPSDTMTDGELYEKEKVIIFSYFQLCEKFNSNIPYFTLTFEAANFSYSKVILTNVLTNLFVIK